jgi:hypothetical protein
MGSQKSEYTRTFAPSLESEERERKAKRERMDGREGKRISGQIERSKGIIHR